MTNTKEFKIAMLRAGLTNKTLSEKVGMSSASLSYKINNIREFKASEIKALQEALNLSDSDVDIIFFGNNVD